MLPSLQAKLLHVLQDGQFSRLGGQGDVRVDVRIVAATNRHLEEAVAGGQFREDLFFRLNVVCDRDAAAARTPRGDPGRWSGTSWRSTRPTTTGRRPRSRRATLETFMQYDWPGNVRELENVIQRIIILGPEVARAGRRWSCARRRAPIGRSASGGRALPGRIDGTAVAAAGCPAPADRQRPQPMAERRPTTAPRSRSSAAMPRARPNAR